jgi:hypothetical protein
VQLVFRASDYAFKVKRLFELNGHTRNLLIICETHSGKMIGGYSPLYHKYDGTGEKKVSWGEEVTDNTETSFLFSMEHNDKFVLKDKKEAIRRYKTNDRICFGYGELEIRDD